MKPEYDFTGYQVPRGIRSPIARNIEPDFRALRRISNSLGWSSSNTHEVGSDRPRLSRGNAFILATGEPNLRSARGAIIFLWSIRR